MRTWTQSFARWAAGCAVLMGRLTTVWGGDVAPARTPVELGRKIFVHNFGQPESWTEKKPLGDGGDGLGPQFNDFSCVACHQQGGVGGAGPNEKNALVVTFIPAPGLSRTALEGLVREARQVHPELSGTQTTAPLHRFGLSSDSDRPAYEQHLAKLFDRLQFDPDVTAPARGANALVTWEIAQRNVTALWGAGAIDELRRRDGDGIRRHIKEEQNRKFNWLSGRLPREGSQTPGWFGWRGQVAALHSFNLGACSTELGLTVPGLTDHPSPVNAVNPKEKRLDLTAAECEALTLFVASLPAPQQIVPAGAAAAERVALGEQVFNNCHCNACHVKDLGFVAGIYSDQLLHDMGPNLCDGSPAIEELPQKEIDHTGFRQVVSDYYGHKTDIFQPPPEETTTGEPCNCECEWKTPPLWGCADSAPYLHDGRAPTLEDAILLHGGEGDTSRRAFELLPPNERSMLFEFLGSLRAPQVTPAGPTLAGGPAARLNSLAAVPAAPAGGVPNATAVMPVVAEADPAIAPRLPAPADAVPLKSADYERLQILLVGLKPTSVNLDRAAGLQQQLNPCLPESGAATYAAALFQKQALKHSEAMFHLLRVSEGTGLYAALASRAVILDEIRERHFDRALAAIQRLADHLCSDSTMAARDRFESARSLGRLCAYLSGPAGIDVARFRPAEVQAQVRAQLPPELAAGFDAGVDQVRDQLEALGAERTALLGLADQARQSDQSELGRKQGDLIQQQAALEQSRQETERQFQDQLARIDSQLTELEQQYAERDGVEQRLAAAVAPLEFRMNSLLGALDPGVSDLQLSSSASTVSQSALIQLSDQINQINRQREDNGTQARIVAIKAQQLVEQRAAAVASYTRQTGRAVQQLESLAKWQGRFAKQADKLGESTADQSQRVKRLDRKIKDLATYERFDAEDEARRMLARYRPAE